MKNQLSKFESNEKNLSIVKPLQNEGSLHCEECDMDFKSDYHLENHIKGSQHSIKRGINRKFGYDLNKKETKRKLLKGASKNPFLKEAKSTCEILHFNDGSYFVCVLPLIEKWKVAQEAGEPVKFKDLVIHVTELRCGKEQGGMVVDVLIKFEVNGNNIVTHCYNTKQKLLINGSGYRDFVRHYLEPYFKETIEGNLLKIQNYNRAVTETFGKMKRKDVKFRPGSKLACKKCDFAADDTSNMSTHNRITHPGKKNISYVSIEKNEVVTSTRDNSVVAIMDENISIEEINDEDEEPKPPVTLEEEVAEEQLPLSHKFHCFLCQTGFEEEADLTNHEKLEHKEEMKLSTNDVKCDLCEQLFDKEGDLDNHVRLQHGKIPSQSQKLHSSIVEIEDATFYCKTCGKYFEEFDLLVEHSVAKHGEVPGIKCDRCEKTFPDSKAVEKHVEIFHTFDEVSVEELKQPDFKCSLCGKIIRTKSGIQRHVELFCEECQQCSAERVSFDIHKSLHTIRPQLKCEKCEFTTIDDRSLKSHIQTIHKNVKVTVDLKDQVMLNCEQCEYTCRLNIQLKKHRRSVHAGKQEELKYNCDVCDYSTRLVLDLWKHREAEHPQLVYNLKSNSKDIALSLLAEQNMDIIDDVSSFKTLFQGVMLEFADKIGSVLENVRDDLLVHSAETKSKVDELDSKVNNLIKMEESKSEKNNKASNVNTHFEKVASNSEKTLKNIAWIGTSVSKVLNRESFEKQNDVELKVFRAHSIDEESESEHPEDKLKFPDNSFKKIVPKVLIEEDFDAVILEAGSIEISNIDVNEAVMDTKQDLVSIKHQWFSKVEEDSKKLFDIAEEAVAKNSKLKVIIIKRLPRFDKSSQDILNIKSQLSTYANTVYDQLLLRSRYHSNIHVTEINLELEKSSYIRNLIYGDRISERFDGVHLRGDGASRHFTYRAIQAMKPILCSKGKKVKVLKNPIKTARSPRHTVQISRATYGHLPGYGDHTDCEQARYVRGDHTDCEQARYARRKSVAPKMTYAQAVTQGGPSHKTYMGGNIYNHLNY